MSRKKREESVDNYTFFFKDGYYVTFPLSKTEFSVVKDGIFRKLDTILLENYAILLTDLRYVAKQEQKEVKKAPVESAVPEHMEQDVYEYIKQLERGLRNGETEQGY